MVKYFNQLKTELKDKSRDEIIEALDVAYQLLDDRDRLFEVIPECPEHGPKCTPYAIEWIKSKLNKEDKLNKVFEPFFTSKTEGKGTGLGLWVSYGIVKSFQGDIKIKSKLNEGTSFIIKLPLN